MLTGPNAQVVQDEVAPNRPDVAAIFAAHRGFVWRMLGHFGVDASDREDVLQEVFVVVHRRIDSYGEHDKMRAWLNAILFRVVKGYRRTRRRRPEYVTDTPPELSLPPAQEHDVRRRQARELMRGWLAELPEEQRLVFLLYEVEQMPMAEVALALDCPRQTAYSRLSKAREHVLAQAKRAAARGGTP